MLKLKPRWYIALTTLALIVFFFFYSLPPTEGERPHSAAPSRVTVLKSPTPQKAAKENKAKDVPHLNDCNWDKLAGIEDCDAKCFAKKLSSWNEEELAAIISEDWEYNTKRKRKSKSLLGKFNEAMIAMHLFHSLLDYTEPPNYSAAKALLLDIVKADPENAYAAYVLAYLYQKVGEEENAKKALGIAANRPKLVSYHQDLYLRLHKIALRSPESYLLAVKFRARTPSPNVDFLKELKSISPEATLELGQRLIAPAEKAQGKLHDILWNAIDHASGLAIMRAVSHGEAGMHKTFGEWMEEDLYDDVEMWTRVECSSKGIQQMLDFQRDRLKSFSDMTN